MTENSPKSLDPRTLAKLKGLQLRAKHIVEGYVAGLHRSPFRGFSIEFAEHREYTPGDDLRYVDWKVFGRTDKIHLKQYEDETNLVCYLVLDSSESMQYQGPDSPLSKFEYAQCLAAAIAWLVLQQQDSVGLVTFDQILRSNLRPSSRASHLQQILQVLDSTTPVSKTSLGPIFHELAERFTKRGVVIVLSDFLDDVDSLLAGLKHFQHRRHDVVLFHIMDPAELEFPFTQPTLFQGMESLPDLLTDPKSLRKAYLAELQQFTSQIRAGCRRQGMDYRQCPTDHAFDLILANYLSQRSVKVT